METDGIAGLHDVCLHTTICTVDTLQKLNFEVLEHLLHSPHLTPLDYCAFGPTQSTLTRCSTSDQQVTEAVHAYLVSQPKTIFFGSTEKLVAQWTKFIENMGGNVQK
jgi:hypothetical protein